MNMNPKKAMSLLSSHSHNCVVGELGVEGRRGQPQPSAGIPPPHLDLNFISIFFTFAFYDFVKDLLPFTLWPTSLGTTWGCSTTTRLGARETVSSCRPPEEAPERRSGPSAAPSC